MTLKPNPPSPGHPQFHPLQVKEPYLMPLPILPHSSQEIATITIGIIHQTGQQTTPVGSPARQSMTLVLLVGEFRMAEAVVFGQRPSVQAVVGKPHPIGIQRTEEWISPKQTRS